MTIKKTLCAAGAIASITSAAAAQTTVAYTSPGWLDFGTTDITNVPGNFLPGWTNLNASPDLGDDLFFVPNESLSGADNDAALWMLEYDSASPLHAASNEEVGLSLSGFTIGQSYELAFSATIYLNTFGGWNGAAGTIQVGITGAATSTWDSSLLVDTGDIDGLNDWVAQSLVFTATSSTVDFHFGQNASAPTVDTVSRFGIDGMTMAAVPSPAAAVLLALGVAPLRRGRR